MSSPVVFWIFCVCSTRKVVGPDWIVYKHSTVLSCKLMSPWFSLLDPKVVWMQTSIVCIGSRDSSRLKKKKKNFCVKFFCSIRDLFCWHLCSVVLRWWVSPSIAM
jgi:hypothetical protein